MLIARAIQIMLLVALYAAWGAASTLHARLRGERTAAAWSRCLARLLEALGPTFIKGGQLLSTRADLLAPSAIESLRHLQDRVRPVATWRVRRELRRALGPRLAMFGDVDWIPTAAGSICPGPSSLAS
jgi:ubiquinone biosynthesis protein